MQMWMFSCLTFVIGARANENEPRLRTHHILMYLCKFSFICHNFRFSLICWFTLDYMLAMSNILSHFNSHSVVVGNLRILRLAALSKWFLGNEESAIYLLVMKIYSDHELKAFHCERISRNWLATHKVNGTISRRWHFAWNCAATKQKVEHLHVA